MSTSVLPLKLRERHDPAATEHLTKHLAVYVASGKHGPYTLTSCSTVLQQRSQSNRPRTLRNIVRVRKVGPHRVLRLIVIDHHDSVYPSSEYLQRRSVRPPARHAVRNHRQRLMFAYLTSSKRQRVRRSVTRHHSHH